MISNVTIDMYTVAMVIYMHLLLCYYGDCFHGNSCFDNTHVAMVTHMLILFVWLYGFMDLEILHVQKVTDYACKVNVKDEFNIQ